QALLSRPARAVLLYLRQIHGRCEPHQLAGLRQQRAVRARLVRSDLRSRTVGVSGAAQPDVQLELGHSLVRVVHRAGGRPAERLAAEQCDDDSERTAVHDSSRLQSIGQSEHDQLLDERASELEPGVHRGSCHRQSGRVPEHQRVRDACGEHARRHAAQRADGTAARQLRSGAGQGIHSAAQSDAAGQARGIQSARSRKLRGAVRARRVHERGRRRVADVWTHYRDDDDCAAGAARAEVPVLKLVGVHGWRLNADCIAFMESLAINHTPLSISHQPFTKSQKARARSRMDAVQAPIVQVVGDLIRQVPGTISLGQGVVHYGPPAAALDAVRASLAQPATHEYQDGIGLGPLVDRLTAKLRNENGIDLGRGSRVMVTAGANMAFMHAVFAITEPGDEIILNVPFYFNHEMAIQMAGCTVVPVATDDRYQPRIDALRAAVTDRTRAIVTVSPNNPSGAVFPEAALRDVSQLCRDSGLYHIADEVYEYFTYGSARHVSSAAFPGADRYTISMFSLSKAYGFAGWRIGYMAYPEHLHDAMTKSQDTILVCATVAAQAGAISCLHRS